MTSYISITGIPEREERLVAENFPKLMTENNSRSIKKKSEVDLNITIGLAKKSVWFFFCNKNTLFSFSLIALLIWIFLVY